VAGPERSTKPTGAPSELNIEPRHEGSGLSAAGYSVTLPHSRHRLLGGVSVRFSRRAPTRASCHRARVALHLPGFARPPVGIGVWVAGCVASRSGSQWAQRCPDFCFRRFRTGASFQPVIVRSAKPLDLCGRLGYYSRREAGQPARAGAQRSSRGCRSFQWAAAL
jgi:hypothetical protein